MSGKYHPLVEVSRPNIRGFRGARTQSLESAGGVLRTPACECFRDSPSDTRTLSPDPSWELRPTKVFCQCRLVPCSFTVSVGCGIDSYSDCILPQPPLTIPERPNFSRFLDRTGGLCRDRCSTTLPVPLGPFEWTPLEVEDFLSVRVSKYLYVYLHVRL